MTKDRVAFWMIVISGAIVASILAPDIREGGVVITYTLGCLAALFWVVPLTAIWHYVGPRITLEAHK